eukprot:5988127-Prymnesium_polylepis.1
MSLFLRCIPPSPAPSPARGLASTRSTGFRALGLSRGFDAGLRWGCTSICSGPTVGNNNVRIQKGFSRF